MSIPEIGLEPVSEQLDTTPPLEEVARLHQDAAARRRKLSEVARTTFEANKKLGIAAAPESIKKRYPDLRHLEAEAAQAEFFPATKEPTPVDQ